MIQWGTIVPHSFRSEKVSTSDFQSEVGEVFGEIGGELPAKFGRRFSSFFCWENRQKHFPPKLHRKSLTIKLDCEVLGCGGLRKVQNDKSPDFSSNFRPEFLLRIFPECCEVSVLLTLQKPRKN